MAYQESWCSSVYTIKTFGKFPTKPKRHRCAVTCVYAMRWTIEASSVTKAVTADVVSVSAHRNRYLLFRNSR